ncbi:MAG: hypothetical protein ABDH49_07415 [Candidatus Hydrothermales bacterium]
MKLFIKILSHELSPALFEVTDENQNIIYKAFEKEPKNIAEKILRSTRLRTLMNYILIIRDLEKNNEIYLEREASLFKIKYKLLSSYKEPLFTFSPKDILENELEIRNKYDEMVGRIRREDILKLGTRSGKLFDNQKNEVGFYEWKIKKFFFTTKKTICSVVLLKEDEIFKLLILVSALIEIIRGQGR